MALVRGPWMDSLAPLSQAPTDYYARALAVWPRLDHPRSVRLRHDPHRVAAMISRRTNLPLDGILALIGAAEVAERSPREGN
jgi:hypothetical protein